MSSASTLALFWQQVRTLSLEALCRKQDLDPMLALLTLPVRLEAQLKVSTPQILERRPDLLSTVLTTWFGRFAKRTLEDTMVIAGIPTDQLLHTRAAQDLLDRGRQEGAARGRKKAKPVAGPSVKPLSPIAYSIAAAAR